MSEDVDQRMWIRDGDGEGDREGDRMEIGREIGMDGAAAGCGRRGRSERGMGGGF
jgi:hypothetical protein